MSRFSGVVYDAASSTATFGSGLVWDDVYSALAPYNVNVVGGRVTVNCLIRRDITLSADGALGRRRGRIYSWRRYVTKIVRSCQY